MRAALAVWLVLVTSAGLAHTRSQSYSHWQLEPSGTLSGQFTIDSRRATLLYADARATDASPAQLLAEHLRSHVAASVDGEPCAAGEIAPRSAPRGYLRVALSFRCPPMDQPPALALRIDAMFRFAATHTHIATIELPGGERVEQVLTPQRPVLQIGDASAVTGLLGFLRTGITHVLSGADHLAFLLGLMLIVHSLRARVLTITAFTLGHSLTLALASLGLLVPQTMTVEALIGFSVVFAALEARASRGAAAPWVIVGLLAVTGVLAAWRAAPVWWVIAACVLMLFAARGGSAAVRRAPWLAGGFGLIHGAGFAGVMLDAELPRDALLPALLGFNIGVEIGQLIVVGLVIVAGHVLASRPVAQRWAPALPAALAGLGMFWFTSRLIGG